VSWRIFVTDSAAGDLSRLSEPERNAVNEDLFAWVDTGPPKANRRELGDLELFEDALPSGFRVTYFVNETEPYVAVLRVRRIN